MGRSAGGAVAAQPSRPSCPPRSAAQTPAPLAGSDVRDPFLRRSPSGHEHSLHSSGFAHRSEHYRRTVHTETDRTQRRQRRVRLTGQPQPLTEPRNGCATARIQAVRRRRRHRTTTGAAVPTALDRAASGGDSLLPDSWRPRLVATSLNGPRQYGMLGTRRSCGAVVGDADDGRGGRPGRAATK